MESRKGKTTRKCSKNIYQDSLIEVNCNKRDKKLNLLLGYEFQSGVQYSTKKKNRWQLTKMISMENYEDDQPIMYSKHQCIGNSGSLLDLYLYDSIAKKEIGNSFVSNQYLQKGSFNVDSSIHEIENRFNYTNKEKNAYEKSKSYGKKKRKQSRLSYRQDRVFVPEWSILPERKEYEVDKEIRENCIRVKEYVQVNNITYVNKISPIYDKRLKISRDDLDILKRRDTRYMKTVPIEDENVEDEIDSVECVEVEAPRPFLLTSDDFLCLNKTIPRKRKRNKKAISWKADIICPEHRGENIELPKSNDGPVINLQEDLLPSVIIETTVDRLVSDVQTIMEMCTCRVSNSEPSFILVDLDDFDDAMLKSFVLLKPTKTFDNGMAVTIIFNMSYLNLMDFNEILDLTTDSVLSLVAFVKSRLQQIPRKRYSSGRKIVMLDGKIDGMSNLWKTSEIDLHMCLFMKHVEWRSVEINEKLLYEICGHIPPSTVECAVCFNDVLEAELIITKACGHSLCRNCISSHIVYRLETGMQEMICPGSDCDNTIDASVMLSLVSWKRYCKRLDILESTIINRGGRPCCFCGAVLLEPSDVTNDKRKIFNFKCICENVICNCCGRQQHFPSTCQEMMKHTTKMAALKDVNIPLMKLKPLVYVGRSCPKCFQFVVKDGGCNHLSCNCGAQFCWGCGDLMGSGQHLTNGFPCYRVIDLVKLDLSQSSLIPVPSSIRPKFYCSALYHYIHNNNYESFRFNKRLKYLLQSNHSPADTLFILAQVSELCAVIESIFVKAYQIDKRRQMHTLRYLKSSVSLFLFYQYRIQSIVDSIPLNDYQSRSKTLSKRTLIQYSQKLTVLVKEVRCLLVRFSHYLTGDSSVVNSL